MKTESFSILLPTGPPRWRSNLLAILQLVGVLLAVIGSGELLGLFSAFDPELARKLAVIGPAIVFAAKPALSLLGDFLDDGERNDSFQLEAEKQKDDPAQGQLPLSLFLVGMLCFLFSACGVRINADGSKDANVDRKTILGLAKVLAEKSAKLLTFLFISVGLISCGYSQPVKWEGAPNPLDEPGETQPTVKERHL